jgi:hypothetical protein
MSGTRISGVVLLVAGAAAILYGVNYNSSLWNQAKRFFVEDQTGDLAIRIGALLGLGGLALLLARGRSSREV